MSSYLQPRLPMPGHQQVHQHEPINALPIKKRRFPIILPPSPEKKTLDNIEDHESKNKRDSQIPDEREAKKNKLDNSIDPKEASSPMNTSDLIANKEVASTHLESGQATAEIIVSEPQGATPDVSLSQVADFGNETENIWQTGKVSLEPEVPESSAGPQTAIVKQEIASRHGSPTDTKRVELPPGEKEPFVFPDLEHKKPIAISLGPEKLDPSRLSLALSEEKSVGLTIIDCTTVGDVGTIRSNWDLNTTMEDWEEGSSKSDVIGGFVKNSICHDEKSSSNPAENFDLCLNQGKHDEKSSSTPAENVDLCLNQGKQHIPDVQKSDSSNATIQLGLQCKIDDALGLRLHMPHSLSGNFITAASPNLGLRRVPVSAINMNRAVKLEPVDESSRRDFCVGSSSNSDMVSLGLGSVNTGSFNNSKSMKPEVNQESCASSSSSLSVLCMPKNYLELSIHNKELQLRPCSTDHKPKLARVDEATADDDEKMNILAELNKESFGSDCGTRENCAVGNSVGIRVNIHGKEDEDLEEGEVREPVQHPVIEEDPVDVWKNSKKLQGSNSEVFDGKDSVMENLLKSDLNRENTSTGCKPNNEDDNINHSHNVSDTALEVRVDEKTFVSVTRDKQLDLSGRENFEETPAKEIFSYRQTNVDSGLGGFVLEDAATTDANKAVEEICQVENISTLSDVVEASLSGQDEPKDSGNKRRIINLSRASVVTSPCKMRPIPNRLIIPRSGKERYSDLDGEIQPWGNREVNYDAGSNKFPKERVIDHSLRNSRPNFMHGRGRMPGRNNSFPSNEWDSEHEFASETSYGPPNYRPFRRKHAPDVETECKAYDIHQDGSNNNRRKMTNNEFRRSSLRRLSPGDNSNRDGPANRGNNPTFRRFPRNISPNGDRFVQNLSNDLMNPVYNSNSQAMYDEPDGQLERSNRNFSNMKRKGYPRTRSKSPVRSRTRSPGPWSSPRRRSPNGLQDLTQHRSQGFYRTGRMRSPERGTFRDEMVPRMRGSPYNARHPNNDLRDVGPAGREHAHPRPSRNPNRRGSPGRVFTRNARRTDALDSREMGDGDEYMNNGPLQSNKFHDERRNFAERRGTGPVRLFRSGYNCGDGENFRFHTNDGPRPYRFCPDTDAEFVERGDNMREREFDGRIKQHQPMGSSRRNRNVEELQDGNFSSVERVWHDDGFGDDSGKKRRF